MSTVGVRGRSGAPCHGGRKRLVCRARVPQKEWGLEEWGQEGTLGVGGLWGRCPGESPWVQVVGRPGGWCAGSGHQGAGRR